MQEVQVSDVEGVGFEIVDFLNQFVVEYLPKAMKDRAEEFKDFKIVREEFIDSHVLKILAYLCKWLYARRYTNTKIEFNLKNEEVEMDDQSLDNIEKENEIESNAN